MSPSQRIASHLRGNVVGYVAVFIALSGTAIALPGNGSVKSNDIAKGAVKGKALATDAVSGPKVRANAITSDKIAAAAVTGADLAGGAVTGTILGDNAVTTAKIADNAVTNPKLANDAVARANIAQGVINGGKIANGAIDSAKVNDGSLLANDFAAGQISDGFAASEVSDLSSNPTQLAYGTTYNSPRAGRLYIDAGIYAQLSCTTVCNRYFAVFVDGTIVPSTTRLTAAGAGETQNRDLSLVGIIPLTAGNHDVEIRYFDVGGVGGATTQTGGTIAGILLQ